MVIAQCGFESRRVLSFFPFYYFSNVSITGPSRRSIIADFCGCLTAQPGAKQAKIGTDWVKKKFGHLPKPRAFWGPKITKQIVNIEKYSNFKTNELAYRAVKLKNAKLGQHHYDYSFTEIKAYATVQYNDLVI